VPVLVSHSHARPGVAKLRLPCKGEQSFCHCWLLFVIASVIRNGICLMQCARPVVTCQQQGGGDDVPDSLWEAWDGQLTLGRRRQVREMRKPARC
jgi:hypothetical protein